MLKSKLWMVYILSGLLFLTCFKFGLLLAEHKPLWNDEIYTQIGNVANKSYIDMLLGNIEEGNNSPLFYILQKGLTELVRYQTPDLWNNQNNYDRLLLRLNPIFFISLSITGIFFYFFRFHSLWMGIYALFITASSFMLWTYWAEARPYGLWFALTTFQSLIFLQLSLKVKNEKNLMMMLMIVHFLLSLTVVFSLAQIAIVSFLLWVLGQRHWKTYLTLTIIPSLIALFYYFNAPKYKFWFDLSPEQLIRDCFSRDRFYILFIFMFFIPFYFLQHKYKKFILFKNNDFIKAMPYLGLTVLMLLAAFLLLFIFKWGENIDREGFPISSRYFIYLTPIGIISTTYLSMKVFKGLSANRWIQIPVLSGMGYLVIHRFWKIIPHIKHTCSGIFG